MNPRCCIVGLEVREGNYIVWSTVTKSEVEEYVDPVLFSSEEVI